MIYYQRYGDRNKKPLVLIHSGGMAGVEWQPQINILTKQFNLFIPDLPGHGKSLIAKEEALSISLMAKAVVEMLRYENIEKVCLLGSSMGGAVALWIALKFPELVEKLIVYRIGYTKNQDTYQQTRNMANPEYWRQYGMHSWLSKLHTPQGDEHSWEQVIASVSKVLDPETSEHNHSLADLATIIVPTLLIAGDNDPLIPVETLFEMRAAIADCALWVIPQATHVTATNMWRARAFAEEVSRFLKS